MLLAKKPHDISKIVTEAHIVAADVRTMRVSMLRYKSDDYHVVVSLFPDFCPSSQ
jgi:hypothetical protein